MQHKIALTIDLEGSLAKLPARVDLLLGLFAQNGVKGTFFILGQLAEGAPEIVCRISQAGHEIGFHGYQHEPIVGLNRDELISQLSNWQRRLEDLAQQKVEGYRAPYFSISRSNAWALDAVSLAGFSYDSSIYPGLTDRFGWVGGPKFPVRLRNSRLIVFPVPTLSAALPIGFSGGGYLRLLPWFIVRWGFRRQFRRGFPGMIYAHPWEIDTTSSSGKSKTHSSGNGRWAEWRESVPGKWGRMRMRVRLEELLSAYRGSLAPMREVISSLREIPQWSHLSC